MKVIVFGATGSIGRLTVAALLEHGHSVTAFARDPAALERTHPALTRVAGDATDARAVEAAVPGHDAVIITLGAGNSRSSRVRSAGTRCIVDAMQHNGVERLICQSTLGAHESAGNLNFFWRRIVFGLLLGPVMRDHERQEDLVRDSGLAWTIVRPSGFQNGPATGDFEEDLAPDRRDLALRINRADIAAFLVRNLQDDRYLQRAVGISR